MRHMQLVLSFSMGFTLRPCSPLVQLIWKFLFLNCKQTSGSYKKILLFYVCHTNINNIIELYLTKSPSLSDLRDQWKERQSLFGFLQNMVQRLCPMASHIYPPGLVLQQQQLHLKVTYLNLFISYITISQLRGKIIIINGDTNDHFTLVPFEIYRQVT